jgi:hypothetical protein
MAQTGQNVIFPRWMAFLTLPLFGVVLNPRFTRPFFAVPRTSVVRTASG